MRRRARPRRPFHLHPTPATTCRPSPGTTGETETLTTKSVLLGAFDFVEYKPRQTRLSPGDVVVIYTDSMTEAVNAENQMFGDERLEKLVKESVSLSAEEIMRRILDEVLSFTAGLPQGDDITLIVLKVK